MVGKLPFVVYSCIQNGFALICIQMGIPSVALQSIRFYKVSSFFFFFLKCWEGHSALLLSCAGGTPAYPYSAIRKEKGSLEFTWKCLFLNKAQVAFLLQCLSKSVPHRVVICSSISFFTLFFQFLPSHQRPICNLYYYSDNICFRIFLFQD